MSIFEYDEEREMKLIKRDIWEMAREKAREEAREEVREEGREEGRKEGRKEGIKESMKYFILDNLEQQIPEERIAAKLQKYFGIVSEEGIRLISLYREAE